MSTSVYDLAVGDQLRIVRDFEDYNRQRIRAGRELVLVDKEYFPHDSGHTLTFEGNVVIRLSGHVPGQRKDRNLTDAEVNSRMKGLDFKKPVQTRPPSTPPPDPPLPPLGDQYRIHGKGKNYGNWFSPDPTATPDSVGVGTYGTTSTGSTEPKVRSKCSPTPGTDPAYMQSTAAPIDDTWSGQGVFGKQYAKGGGTQNYVPQPQGQAMQSDPTQSNQPL